MSGALHRQWLADEAAAQSAAHSGADGACLPIAKRKPAAPDTPATRAARGAPVRSRLAVRRPRPAARLALRALGSYGALATCVAIAAAALLLTACGPSDIDALQADALNLQDAKAAAVLAAAGAKAY